MAIERNAPCPCGSGRRYKACHGALAALPSRSALQHSPSGLPGVPVPEAAGAALPTPELLHRMGVALRSQQAGNLALAEALYREVLEQLPDEPDCLHMLGVLCYQSGRHREAIALIAEAIELTQGRIPAMHQNLLLVAAKLRDEPVFWDAGGGTAAAALFAPHAARHRGRRARALLTERGIRVLVIDLTIPKPDRDSGSMRMAAILRLWKEIGCSVALATMVADHDANRDAWLDAAGVEFLSGPEGWAGPTQVLAAFGSQFDVVLVSRVAVALSCMTLLRHFAPQALFVFDTVDLHFLRLQREARSTGDAAAAARAAIVRQQELGVARSADLTLVVSDVEQALLHDEVPGARVELLSNVHEVHGRRQGFEQRRDVFFVGSFAHAPNVDAVQWYVADVWPRIRRRLPRLQTFIVGSDMPATVVTLASDGIVVVGHAPDLGPWLEGCRVAIAPLRFGAGVKGKVNIALAAGVPVVATTIAAEGMHLEPGRDVLLGDTADEFADAVVRLHEERTTWTSISDAGLGIARRHFSPQSARQVLERLRDLALSRRQGRSAGDVPCVGDEIVRRDAAAGRRVLILSPASYGSLGDEAMVRGVASCIRSLADGWEVDLLSIYGGEHWPVLPGIRRVVHLHPGAPSRPHEFLGRFEPIVRHYRAFAVLGADVLDGHYSIDESVQRLELARVASEQGCATAILGFSFNDQPATEALAGLGAVAARAPLYVRDPATLRRLKSCGVRNLVLVADLAFLMRPSAATAMTRGVEAWIRMEHASGRRVVIINLSAQAMAEARHGRGDSTGDLIEMASDLVTHHAASILWCPHDLRQAASPGESDGELAADLARRAARRIGDDVHQHLVPPMGANEVKRVVGRVDLVVSARMHLAIAAFGMGKPVIGIAYQGKFEGLWEHFGLQGNLFDARSLDGSRLHEACIEALGSLDDLGAQVQARRPSIVALARRQLDLWLAGAADVVPAHQ